MRYFCFRKNAFVCPKINVEKLWTLLSPAHFEAAKKNAGSGKATVIDCTKAGIFKVLGKGTMPDIPVIVKARFFSKDAEKKINEAGGVCVLDA
jgi:ribosomal protein L15